MAGLYDADVVEHIMIRLDVKHLINCKRVCKSWHSLLTSPGFINRHLNRSYNEDRNNNEIGHRRIMLDDNSGYYTLVGSSNGLVCLYSKYSCKLLVGNPLTREVRQLKLPPYDRSSFLCWGFGYDSYTHDYMVMVGIGKGNQRYAQLQMLNLKSNVWRFIRGVKYTFTSRVGVLCNGALHWIVSGHNFKEFIVSYNLSKAEFKEIPKPDDARCEGASSIRLGVLKECLCMFRKSIYSSLPDSVWLMKNYNAKQSWELLRHNHGLKYDTVHFLKKDATRMASTQKFLYWRHYIDAPIFVKSLVSPHVSGD